MTAPTRVYDHVKRGLDLAVAGALLLLTLPIQVLVAVLVRCRLGSPVLFRQPRPGRHGQIFTLLKFRTMRPPADPSEPDADRLEPFGALLRSTSLDELPTLWNVVRGDMSITGPRPLLVDYLPLYTPEQARRHEVRPGVTGLAQVSGRNTLTWEERFRLDVRYVVERGPRLDAAILGRTVRAVLAREGIGHGNAPTGYRYTGPAARPEKPTTDHTPGLGAKAGGRGRRTATGTRALRVGIVSQYYPPEDVQIPGAVAQGLAARGHDVRVLTAFPSYPEGRLQAGWRQRTGHVEQDGEVELHRVPTHISHSRQAVARSVSYVSFAAATLAAGRRLREADVIYVYATQMTAAVAPLVWSVVRGTPFVLHVQDLWPESVTGSGMVSSSVGDAISNVMSPWLRRTYSEAAATIAISPTMTRTLISRGVPADRAHTLHNWAPAAFDAVSPMPSGGKGLRLTYAGNIGEMQDLDSVMRALALVRDLPVHLDVYGSGTAEHDVRVLASSLDLRSVTFHGRRTAADIAPMTASADFHLVTLKDLPVFRMTIPSKLQASLALGIPVISTVAGDLADLVDRHGIGFQAPAGDPAGIAAAMRRAAASTTSQRAVMRAAARRLAEQEMSREKALERIESILAAAAQTGPHRGALRAR